MTIPCCVTPMFASEPAAKGARLVATADGLLGVGIAGFALGVLVAAVLFFLFSEKRAPR